MSKYFVPVLFSLCVCTTAQAQFGFGSGSSQRVQRPLGNNTVSPYINLLREGGTGLNYFGIVRPEQQLGASVQQLQGGLASLRQGGRRSSAGFGGGMTTGHAVVFDSFRQGGGSLGGGFGGGFGLGGGGGGFQPGFLGQGAAGGFGGFSIGGGGSGSFSPIEGGVRSGGGVFPAGGTVFGGGATQLGSSGGGAAAGRQAAAGGGAVGRGTPWGIGVPAFAAPLGSTGHVVQFDTFRQNSVFGGQ